MTTAITITRALVEIKTLDARITDAISKTLFVSTSKGRDSNKKPTQSQFVNEAEVIDFIKAGDKSIKDMITRRSKIKAEIAKANVNTKVKIGGEDMSIVEAIDMKHTIGYKRQILSVLMAQIRTAASNIEQSRERTENDVQISIERLLGSDVKNKEAVAQNAALIESTKKAILDMHELSLIDPLDIKKRITELQKEIGDVEDEVDFALSEVNAQTTIEV